MMLSEKYKYPIDLDRPIDHQHWQSWKKTFSDNNPLRKTRIAENRMQIMCDSEKNRDKIIAYLVPKIVQRFGEVI